MAQLVERVLGKDEVPGPNPGSSSIFTVRKDCEHEKPLLDKGFSLFVYRIPRDSRVVGKRLTDEDDKKTPDVL